MVLRRLVGGASGRFRCERSRALRDASRCPCRLGQARTTHPLPICQYARWAKTYKARPYRRSSCAGRHFPRDQQTLVDRYEVPRRLGGGGVDLKAVNGGAAAFPSVPWLCGFELQTGGNLSLREEPAWSALHRDADGPLTSFPWPPGGACSCGRLWTTYSPPNRSTGKKGPTQSATASKVPHGTHFRDPRSAHLMR